MLQVVPRKAPQHDVPVMKTQAFQRNRAFIAVLVGGSIAATLDILYAFIVFWQDGRSPLWVLQLVASGLLGAKAFESGVGGGLVGLAAHYLILIGAAAVYFAASTRLPVLRSRAVVCGALFGVLIYLFMNFVVLPLSAFPFKPSYPALKLLQGFAWHAVLVGIPIAVSIRRLSNPTSHAAGA
jgi:hypothetical protein